ncbi:MAG: hypothetical protein J6O91_02875 [Aeriscardovia sp.]|nr:hypothetical protein [Aeriscardovia sp.]
MKRKGRSGSDLISEESKKGIGRKLKADKFAFNAQRNALAPAQSGLFERACNRKTGSSRRKGAQGRNGLKNAVYKMDFLGRDFSCLYTGKPGTVNV